MIFIFLIFCLLFCIGDSYRDSYMKKHNTVNHYSVGFNYLLIIIMFALLQKYPLKIWDNWEYLQMGIVMITIRYVVVDGFYNLFMKKDWNYQGTTAPTDTWIKGWFKFALKCLLGFFSLLFVLQWILR